MFPVPRHRSSETIDSFHRFVHSFSSFPFSPSLLLYIDTFTQSSIYFYPYSIDHHRHYYPEKKIKYQKGTFYVCCVVLNHLFYNNQPCNHWIIHQCSIPIFCSPIRICARSHTCFIEYQSPSSSVYPIVLLYTLVDTTQNSN